MAGTRSTRRRRAPAPALALAIATATLAAALAAPAGGQSGPVAPRLNQIGSFDAPVHVEDAPGEPKLLFVVEQPGRIAVLRRGRRLGKPFLNLTDRVTYSGEQGLLSVAFDPDYQQSRRFFVFYVNRAGNLQVDGLKTRRKSAVRASKPSRRKVIEIRHPSYENHDGGQVAFGPDGLLYVGTGDGGGAGDPDENAQDPDSLLGKLLRIEPGRKRGYSTPASNPFAGGPGRDEVFALGLRNPYRFSFDAEAETISIGDVGQDDWEELDHLPLAAANGANFGWDNLEGNAPFEAPFTEPADYRAPVQVYWSNGGNCTVIGGHVVRDPGLPSLAGRLLYADFCKGTIRSLDPGAADPSATDASTGLSVSSPSSFGEGRDGRLYVTSLDGPVYRIAGG